MTCGLPGPPKNGRQFLQSLTFFQLIGEKTTGPRALPTEKLVGNARGSGSIDAWELLFVLLHVILYGLV